jgi:hypothetical protein
VQGYDRYSYANNNPLKYIDPSGHDNICTGSEVKKTCTITGEDVLLTEHQLMNLQVAEENAYEMKKSVVVHIVEIIKDIFNLGSPLPDYPEGAGGSPFQSPDAYEMKGFLDNLETSYYDQSDTVSITLTYDTTDNTLTHDDDTADFGDGVIAKGLDLLFGTSNDGDPDSREVTKMWFPSSGIGIGGGGGGGQKDRHYME